MKKIAGIIKQRKIETVTVLLCMAVLCLFVSMKQGFHMDELLSFELANAEFNPWIVPTQPQGRLAKFVQNELEGETFGETAGNITQTVKDVLQNKGNSKLLSYTADVYEEPVWITGKQFQEYITVDKKDAFQYLSVYFNVKDDNHPPLHFMVLHTISSIFQRKISPWMGCIINLSAILGILLALFQISHRAAPVLGLEKYGRLTGIMAVLLYGLSCGAVATTLLIRMYGMVTLWCVLYFYLVMKKMQDASFDKKNGWLILVTVCGFWTQYFFLFYCLLLAALITVLLIKKKRFHELFCFVRAMVLAAVLGLGLFPFAISDVFSSGRGVEALGNLSQGFSGFSERLAAFGRILVNRTMGGIPVGIPAILFLLAAFSVIGKKRYSGKEQACGAEKEKNLTAPQFWWMLLFPAIGYFLLAARMSPYLVDRYIMPLFPFTALLVVFAVFTFMGRITDCYPHKQTRGLTGAVCFLLVFLQLLGLFRYDGTYLYQGYQAQLETSKELSGLPCICVYDGVGYYENLQEFCNYEKTLLVTLPELQNRKDMESINELTQVVVLVKSNVEDTEVLEFLTENGFVLKQETWYQPSAYGDSIYLMEREGA